MSDKSLEEDAVPSIKSQGSIPFSPEIMRTLVDTCRKQKVQLKGLANIQNLVQVKEEELTAAKEKITNLTAALDKSEIRQANLIRLLGNGGRSPGQSVSTSGDYALSAVSLQKRTQTGSCSLNSKLQYSDIEEDGAGPTIAEDCQTFSEIPSVSALRSDSKSSVRGRLEADACTFEGVPPLTLSENNFMSGASVCLPSNCFTLDPLAFPDSRSKLPSCSSIQPSFNSAPGVSKDLLDKIVQQNVRLKKATREILNQRGMSLNSYLDKQEYEDIISQSKEDLRVARKQISQLKSIISSRNEGKVDELSAKCAIFIETITKLEKALATSQVMTDSLNLEYDRIKAENTELRVRASGNSSVQPKIQPASSQQEVSVLMKQLTEVQMSYNAIFEKYEKEKSLWDTLRQSNQDLERKCYNLEIEIERTRNELASMTSQLKTRDAENSLLRTQVTAYQEDFASEQKASAEKLLQLQNSLVKHQDWIKKLAAEAQKCRTMLGEEQASSRVKDEKIQKLEQLTQQTSSKQARQYHAQQSCAQEMQKMNLFLPRELHDLAIDGGEQKSSLQGDNPSSCLQAMGSSNSSSSSTKFIRRDSDSLSFDDDDARLVCPRCEREFKQSERAKFEEHMSKCTDD